MTQRPVVKRLRYRLYGLVFLMVASLFVALCVGFYNKAFTPVTTVDLRTDHIGNQLSAGADVKVRGMIVGDVRAISAERDGAVLQLALDPEQAETLPANVSARLLPKTLFGERYVELRLPETGTGETLSAGAVIEQDRSSAAIEVQRVLDNLMPVLRAVQPEKLSTTLHAISSSLAGRGEQLGDTLVELNTYLEGVLPAMPDLRANIDQLAEVSDVYTEAAPDLLRAMRDLSTTTRTVEERQDQLRGLFDTLTTASGNLDAFLRANKDNLIALSANVQSTLGVLAKYAPQYPCLLESIVNQIPAADRAFGKGTAHPEVGQVTLKITSSRGKYRPGVDEPENLDKRGPRCYPSGERPDRMPQYPAEGPIQDGASKPPPGRTENPERFQPTIPQSATGSGSSVANTPAERELISALVAPELEVMPDEAPTWASLLVGPVYRGTEVSLR
ncbi:virulence factor Mce-like protein [Tamaricihabitans halophyticus]|uniref:Virulence factor Mce-like protein n=1 Tax=Tamaricihabitans halophyticus TaxID=1262583 RepID=A0A4R2Q928_9PSEU|nr:MCE family protein [Tamaricihabitans halophyticus]TCP45387.1 virulence factor Mce-like protein [Tamaricihabitans halophyticus]